MPRAEVIMAAVDGDVRLDQRGLARLVVAHRRAIAVFWTATAALLAPAASRIEHVLDAGSRVRGSESARVEERIADRFASPFGASAILVASGLGSDTAVARTTVARIVRRLRGEKDVRGTISLLDGLDPSFDVRGGTTFIVVGLAGTGANTEHTDRALGTLRAVTDSIERNGSGGNELSRMHLRWTGEAPLKADIRRASADDAGAGEVRALPLTLILLLLAFGAVVAAVLPLATGVLAIVISLGVVALLTRLFPLSILLANVVTMLGLGLGIDYALLMVSRFREELTVASTPAIAAEETLRRAGHTVMVSSGAVLVGFLALLLVQLDDLRAVAVGGIVVVFTAALIALTLVPALLAMLGGRVNALRVRGRSAPARARSQARWRAWSEWVVTHPARVLVLGTTPLALLGAATLRMNTSLPRAGWLPTRMESVRAVHDLAQAGNAGAAQTLRVVIDLPDGARAYSPAAWAGVRRLADVIERDRRVARAQSLPGVVERQLGVTRPDLTALSLLPPSVPASLVSRDQRSTIIEVVPKAIDDYAGLTALARELRLIDAAAVTGVPGSHLTVGGMPAFNADYEDVLTSRTVLVVWLVLAATFVALALSFRSLLIPLKALALNLLSIGAALGATVLVFQLGHGSGALGLSAPLGGLFPALPILVFCLVFGLSMDYEVFLVSRIAESREAGASDDAAIVDGVVRTGGVITSAAAVMIAVFGAFTLGDFVMVKILGFALGVAVLVDATIVRLAIGPALLALAGRYNWWPGTRGITRSDAATS